MHVRLHQFLDQIDLLEPFNGARLDHIDDTDDVFADPILLEEAEELNLSEGAEGLP